MALSYLKLSDYQNAMKCAEEAISFDKTQTEPYIILAECYMNSAKSDLCLEVFEKAEIFAQADARFYTNWGMALQKYNYIDKAREKLNKALSLDNGNAFILFNLGVNFMLAKEYTQAEEYFQNVLQITPLHPQALYNLATIKYNKSEYSPALDLYKKSFDADKKNYGMYFHIANCYKMLNDFEQAKFYFKKCIEYCPKFVQAYLNYADLLLTMNENTEAKRKARTAFLLDKNSAYTNFAYGVVLLKLGEFEEAKEKFSNAIKIDEKYDLAYLGMCEVCLNTKEYDKSLSYLEFVSQEGRNSKEFEELETRVFGAILHPEENKEEVSQKIVNTAFEYCNKILEQYNNDKIVIFKNMLIEKYKIEAE